MGSAPAGAVGGVRTTGAARRMLPDGPPPVESKFVETIRALDARVDGRAERPEGAVLDPERSEGSGAEDFPRSCWVLSASGASLRTNVTIWRCKDGRRAK